MTDVLISLASGASMGAAFYQPGKPWVSGIRAGFATISYFLAFQVLT